MEVILLIVPIIYPSAGEFWLNSDPNAFLGYSLDSRKLVTLPAGYPFHVTSKSACEVADILHVSKPLYIAAPHENYKRRSKNCVVRKQRIFPPNCFVHFRHMEYDIFLAGPEFCFLLAARSLDFIDLVKLGYDLCALFYPDPQNNFGQSSRTCFTQVPLIREFLIANSHLYSAAKAQKALRYVHDFSNSPMETRLAMFSSLPDKYGGCEMNLLGLNKVIGLTKEGRMLTGYSELHGDLVFKNIVAEYNSSIVHLNADHYTEDMNRQTALKLAGYEYIAITAGHVKNYFSLLSVMNSIRFLLKMQPLKDTPIRRDLYFRLFDFHNNVWASDQLR